MELDDASFADFVVVVLSKKCLSQKGIVIGSQIKNIFKKTHKNNEKNMILNTNTFVQISIFIFL